MRLRHDASCKYCLLERHGRSSFLGSAISFASKNKQEISLSQKRGCVAFKSTTSCSPGIRSGPEKPETAGVYRQGSLELAGRHPYAQDFAFGQKVNRSRNLDSLPTRSLSRPIVIDQKWRTGPISHVQFGVFVKLS